MSSPRITFSYSSNAGGDGPRLLLEQEPVATSNLSLTDLANMLALVRSGISARTYIADSCAASLINGQVVVPLTVYVWPSEENQEYTLTPSIPEWMTIAPAVAIEQERDFDLILPEAAAVDLPFLAADVEIEWQTPAITSKGVVIPDPVLTMVSGGVGLANGLRVDQAVFGVLRVRCRATGFMHAVTLSIPKTGETKVEDIQAFVTARWSGGSAIQVESLDLKLPTCVKNLLEACDDVKRTPGIRVEVTIDEPIPELRYSTCTGQPIGVVRLVYP